MAHRIRTLILLCLALCVLQAEGLQKNSLAWKIYKNECSANPDKLIHWNRGETFPSLGIGHFIWYPKSVQERFTESFPKLIAFLEKEGANPPQWIKGHCPWRDKTQMQNDPRTRELRRYLINTMPLQAHFLQKQLNHTLPRMLSGLPAQQKEHIIHTYHALQSTPQGRYALLDYRNFKGDGTSQKERYNGKGWGLRQVLLCMPQKEISVIAFVHCAKKILKERVKNAPESRHEERWLKGWYNRLDTYLAD